MDSLFYQKRKDIDFFLNKIKEHLPEKIIDVHAHIWLKEFENKFSSDTFYYASPSWTSLLSEENSLEDLLLTYQFLFNGFNVIPVIFGNPELNYDIELQNKYTGRISAELGYPALALTKPDWDQQTFEKVLSDGRFNGCKVYMSYADSSIPESQIRIFDYLPRAQLEVLDSMGMAVMLHIPRSDRLKDQDNLADLIEIDRKYPNIDVIVAHVGRAYCVEDLGYGLDILSDTKLNFDISANCNKDVFYRLIKSVGPGRILFGSDLPITKMKASRICENGKYINIVPQGIYSGINEYPNMREANQDEESEITFFLYEELHAFIQAGLLAGFNSGDFEDVFFNNAEKIFFKEKRK